MARTKTKKRQVVVPKGGKFMPWVRTKKMAEMLRNEPIGTPKIRMQACLLRRQGASIRNISKQTGVPYTTVYDGLARMAEGGLKKRHNKKRGGNWRHVKHEIKRAIRRWLDSPPDRYGFQAGDWTLDMAVSMVYKKFGIEYKPHTLRRIIKRMGYTYCKPRPVPAKSASRRVQKRFMRETNDQVVQLEEDGYAILAEDEAAAQKWSGGGYAWRRKGGRDTVHAPFTRRTVKMFGAVGKKGHHIQVVDALNSVTFIAFLKLLLIKYRKFAMVLDNAAYHKSRMVDQFIKSTCGRIVLIFLPPHTPQLNPVEVQWRELKRLLSGRCFRSLEDLKCAIEAISAGELKTVKMMPYLTCQYSP